MALPPEQRSIPERFFLSPDEPRLRAGWRILLHLLLAAVLMVGFSLLLGVVFLFIPDPPPALAAIANQLAILLAVLISVYLARRFLDRRTFSSLGLVWNRRAGLDLVAGAAIAGAMMGLIFLAEWAAGWLQIDGLAWQEQTVAQVLAGLFVGLAIFTSVGWVEELITRGYWLQNLTDGLNLPWAVILTSTAFAILHLANPNASWIIVIGLTASGLFFAYAYLRTRQLWLPISLHIAWNFFEGPLFGFPVSGIASYQFVRQTVSGPELLTGGAFGPEAGLILFPALAIGALLIFLYTRNLQDEHESDLPRRLSN